MATSLHPGKSVKTSMTLTETLSMGVGAMVGAGIFALMGDAGSIAGNAVYISFIIAGILLPKTLLHETGASGTLVFLALISNTAILVIFVVQISRTNPTVLYFLILTLPPVLLFEAYMQKVKNRSFNATLSFRCAAEEGVL